MLVKMGADMNIRHLLAYVPCLVSHVSAYIPLGMVWWTPGHVPSRM